MNQVKFPSTCGCVFNASCNKENVYYAFVRLNLVTTDLGCVTRPSAYVAGLPQINMRIYLRTVSVGDLEE